MCSVSLRVWELVAQLELVRRGQSRKPDRKPAQPGCVNDLTFEDHGSVVFEVNRERSGLTGERGFPAGLEEASSEADVGKMIET